MPTRPWAPPAAFNFIATLIAFGAAIGLAWMAWNYYEYTPWTRDGRVRVYTVQVAPEVSGTVVSLPIKGVQFLHKGDVLFQIDPRTYENKLKQATGRLAQAQAQANYLEAEAMRRSQLSDLAVSAEQRQNAIGIAQAANAAVVEATGALDQARLDLERTTIRSPVNGWVSDLILQQGGYATAGAFSADIALNGELEHWNGKRIIAFVQDQHYGRIRGAAFRLLSPTAPN